jgi:hypothetical protein
MESKKLRELAEAIRAQTVWEASPGIVVKLLDCSDGVLALLDEIETLRAVLSDILALNLITEDSPLLLARAKAALGGGA